MEDACNRSWFYSKHDQLNAEHCRSSVDNYYSPEELEFAMTGFVDYYNNHRYHESLNNLTPADVYFGRGEEILKERALIKKRTMKQRRTNYYRKKHMEINLVKILYL